MNADQDSEGLGIYPREIAAAIYRRRRWLIVPMVLAFAVAVIVVLFQKPEYRSTATLLIDSQQIPNSVVKRRLPVSRMNASQKSVSRCLAANSWRYW